MYSCIICTKVCVIYYLQLASNIKLSLEIKIARVTAYIKKMYNCTMQYNIMLQRNM